MPMDDRTLLRILKDEEADAASFYDSDLAEAQAEAMRRYNADLYGDEVEGHSKVVTHDIEDAINWIMPDLMRGFLASDDLVTVEPGSPEDEQFTENAQNYISHVTFKDNPGDVVIHDMLFDGLLQRIGVVSVTYEDAKPKPPMMIEGVTIDKLSKYVDDDEYEILEQSESTTKTDFGEIPVFALKVKKTPKMGRVVIEGVPPEEYAFSRRSGSITNVDYERRKKEVFLRDLMATYPGQRAELELRTGTVTNEAHDADTDERLTERFVDEPESTFGSHDESSTRAKVYLLTEYIRVDYDDDNIVELRQIKRVGDVILENEIVDKSEFRVWSPIRVAHKRVGRSIHDQIGEIQKINTVLSRRALDSLDQALNPRKVVNNALVSEDGIDALLDNEVGAVVEVTGDVRSAIADLTTPDVSGSAFQMLEYWGRQSAERTGITPQTQGLDPKEYNPNHSGAAISLLQAPAAARKDLIMRWATQALQGIFEAVMHLLCAHQDHARMLKINGEWTEFDPRLWSDEMSVTVHAGSGAGTRETELSGLGMIAAKQEQILLNAPGNPIVGLGEYRNTLARQAEVMGYKDPTKFYREMPEGEEQPQEQESQDPEVMQAQAKAEREMMVAEQEQQRKTQQMQLEQQRKDVELQAEQDRKERELASEINLKERQIAAELDLKERQIGIELEIKRAMARHKAANGLNGNTGIASSEVHVGGDPG